MSFNAWNMLLPRIDGPCIPAMLNRVGPMHRVWSFRHVFVESFSGHWTHVAVSPKWLTFISALGCPLKQPAKIARKADPHMAMGQNGEFTYQPKWDPTGFDSHRHIFQPTPRCFEPLARLSRLEAPQVLLRGLPVQVGAQQTALLAYPRVALGFLREEIWRKTFPGGVSMTLKKMGVIAQNKGVMYLIPKGSWRLQAEENPGFLNGDLRNGSYTRIQVDPDLSRSRSRKKSELFPPIKINQGFCMSLAGFYEGWTPPKKKAVEATRKKRTQPCPVLTSTHQRSTQSTSAR